jgi:hypothetical protein
MRLEMETFTKATPFIGRTIAQGGVMTRPARHCAGKNDFYFQKRGT